MRNKLYLLASFLLVSTLLAGCAGAALAQASTPETQTEDSNKPVRTISVNGAGMAMLTPDIAYINIGVHTEDGDAAKAVNENNTQAQAVIDALKAKGVDEKDIQTTNFSIYPQQEYDPDGKPTGKINYIVDNSVYVTVRGLDTVGSLLNAVVEAGANSINGIQFDVADKTAALSEARKAAMQNAQAVAEELASAAGVTLGEIQSISTYSSEAPMPVYKDRAAAGFAMDASVPISSGQLTISVDVSVIFEIQ